MQSALYHHTLVLLCNKKKIYIHAVDCAIISSIGTRTEIGLLTIVSGTVISGINR